MAWLAKSGCRRRCRPARPASAAAVPTRSTQCASSAAPVGVQSSVATGPAYVGTPRSSSTTAGGGTLSRPCVVSTLPEPTATGLAVQRGRGPGRPARRRPRRCRRSRRGRPTSWKCTSSMSTPWTAASASRQPDEDVAAACSAITGRRRVRSISARTSREPAVRASSRRPRRGVQGRQTEPRRTCVGLDGRRLGCHGRRPRSGSARRSAPASSTAPSSMSPLAPEPRRSSRSWRRSVGRAVVRRRAALRATRAANTPAPKPLSMLTTMTPGAQELSIAKQRGDPAEGGAVADAGRHGHEGYAGQSADDRGQRALHPGHHDQAVGSRPARSRTPSTRCSPATPTSLISSDAGAEDLGR